MCGSGTLAIEAAMIAYNIPPQKNRKCSDHCNWLSVILALKIIGFYQPPPKQIIKSKSTKALRNEENKIIIRNTISLSSWGLFGVLMWLMWFIIDPWFTSFP